MKRTKKQAMHLTIAFEIRDLLMDGHIPNEACTHRELDRQLKLARATRADIGPQSTPTVDPTPFR